MHPGRLVFHEHGSAPRTWVGLRLAVAVTRTNLGWHTGRRSAPRTWVGLRLAVAVTCTNLGWHTERRSAPQTWVRTTHPIQTWVRIPSPSPNTGQFHKPRFVDESSLTLGQIHNPGSVCVGVPIPHLGSCGPGGDATTTQPTDTCMPAPPATPFVQTFLSGTSPMP